MARRKESPFFQVMRRWSADFKQLPVRLENENGGVIIYDREGRASLIGEEGELWVVVERESPSLPSLSPPAQMLFRKFFNRRP